MFFFGFLSDFDELFPNSKPKSKENWKQARTFMQVRVGRGFGIVLIKKILY